MYITVDTCPLVVLFSFISCIVQHLGLLEKSQGIRSVLEGSTLTVCVQRFWRMHQSCWWTCWLFPRDLSWLFHPIFLAVSTINSGLWSSSDRSFLAAFLWSSSSLVTCVVGAPKFLEWLPRNWYWCTRKYSTWLLVSLFSYGEGLGGMYSLISRGISRVAVFPLIL